MQKQQTVSSGLFGGNNLLTAQLQQQLLGLVSGPVGRTRGRALVDLRARASWPCLPWLSSAHLLRPVPPPLPGHRQQRPLDVAPRG
jgi:hypothetical protein